MALPLLLSLVLAPLVAGENDTRPVIDTPLGALRGVTLSVKGTERLVHAFYGVPFARPPVGSLRLAAPEPPEPWSGVREAADYPPVCLQDQQRALAMLKIFKAKIPPATYSEDCLYLNVFTPASRGSSELPVMVFIHGGGLNMGGASMFEGAGLSTYEDLVLVSIQYRLGFLGFFSFGEESANGNYGFLDQVAALRWVKENIESFGGDPEKVTIFGESAGGVSVSALVLSPLARGLFHRAIAQSGSALMPSLMQYEPRRLHPLKSSVASVLSCDPESVLFCVREKSEEEVAAVAGALGRFHFSGVLDGKFLRKSAEESLARGEVAPVPFLMGVNNQEFGWMLPMALNFSGLRDGMEKPYVRWALEHIPMLGVEPHLIPPIMDEYFNDTEDPLEIRDRFLDLCGDLVFVFPALRTAAYHRDGGHPVYFYEFQHRPSLFHEVKPNYVRADHADEMFSVVGGPFLKAGLLFSGSGTEEEKTLSKTMMKYWANFARHGDPNGPGLELWPEYDEEEDYLQINLQQTAARDLRGEKFRFWKTLLRSQSEST